MRTGHLLPCCRRPLYLCSRCHTFPRLIPLPTLPRRCCVVRLFTHPPLTRTVGYIRDIDALPDPYLYLTPVTCPPIRALLTFIVAGYGFYLAPLPARPNVTTLPLPVWCYITLPICLPVTLVGLPYRVGWCTAGGRYCPICLRLLTFTWIYGSFDYNALLILTTHCTRYTLILVAFTLFFPVAIYHPSPATLHLLCMPHALIVDCYCGVGSALLRLTLPRCTLPHIVAFIPAHLHTRYVVPVLPLPLPRTL